MKGYDRRFGGEPDLHGSAADDNLKMIIIGLVILAVVLALL